MGISASQARFLSLTARKNNIEFQGQQINQQRTTLSTISAEYNSKLLGLHVPTPPSPENYTKTTYSFRENGETNTITGTNYDATTNKYSVNYKFDTVVPRGEDKGSVLFVTDLDGTYKTSYGTVLSPVVTTPGAAGYSAEDAANVAKIQADCGFTPAEIAGGLFKYGEGQDTKYVLATDLAAHANSADAISTYGIDNNHSVTQNAQLLNATVTWADSGRMESLTTVDGKKYDLTVNTEADDKAYNNAMNEYEYQKSLYDKSLDEINAKLSIVQAQDKSLELKLKNCDTEHNAVQTEIDAVKKVIDKAVESSFKTFG